MKGGLPARAASTRRLNPGHWRRWKRASATWPCFTCSSSSTEAQGKRCSRVMSKRGFCHRSSPREVFLRQLHHLGFVQHRLPGAVLRGAVFRDEGLFQRFFRAARVMSGASSFRLPTRARTRPWLPAWLGGLQVTAQQGHVHIHQNGAVVQALGLVWRKVAGELGARILRHNVIAAGGLGGDAKPAAACWITFSCRGTSCRCPWASQGRSSGCQVVVHGPAAGAPAHQGAPSSSSSSLRHSPGVLSGQSPPCGRSATGIGWAAIIL